MANIWDVIFGSAFQANYVLASPNGSAGPLTARALVASDIPSLSGSYVAVGAAASGDLSGTYPSPTVAQIQGGAIPTSTTIVGTNGSGQIVDASSAALSNNTSGTAANLSGTPALPNGTTATTQTAGDNSTKLATTAYVDGEAPVFKTSGFGGFFNHGLLSLASSQVLGANAGNAVSQNQVRVMQFELLKTQAVAHIQFHITAGVSGGVVDVGIYNSSGNLLINAGGVAATGASNVDVAPKQGTVTLKPGVYFFAYTAASTGTITTIGWDCFNFSGWIQNSMVTTHGNRVGTAATAATAGVLPSTLGVITTSTATDYPPLTFFEA
jgi:hypothetical protein